MRGLRMVAGSLVPPMVMGLAVNGAAADPLSGLHDGVRGHSASVPERSKGDTVGMLAYAATSPSTDRHEIYTIRTDGSKRRRLTSQGGFAPVWSPDGARIAYQRRNEIWLMDAAGGSPERLLPGTSPAWAPNGQVISYVCGEGSLCLLDINTGATRELVSSTEEWPSAGDSTWSPDGNWVAFTRYGTGGDYEPLRKLFRVNLEGSELHEIRKTDGAVSPAWSPDGETILYTLPNPPRYEFAADLWSIRPDGTQRTRVTRLFGDEYGGAWSPNGRRLVTYSAGGLRPYMAGIWTMDPDGSDRELVVRFGAQASWRPHFKAAAPAVEPVLGAPGAAIAYVAATDAGFDLFTVPPDGGPARRLTRSGRVYEAAWSPDHRHIAFGDRFPLGGIFVFDVRTGGIRRVSDISFFDNFDSITWSSDGRRLAWFEYREVVVVNLRTLVETRIPTYGVGCCPPRDLAWSPDATTIAFVSGKVGDIRIMSLRNGREHRLRHIRGSEGHLEWSNDGRRIVFTNSRGNWTSTRTRVMSIRSDGTGLRVLLDTPRLDSQPAMSPDGSRIAVYSDGPAPFGNNPQPGLWVVGVNGQPRHLVMKGRAIAYVDW